AFCANVGILSGCVRDGVPQAEPDEPANPAHQAAGRGSDDAGLHLPSRGQAARHREGPQATAQDRWPLIARISGERPSEQPTERRRYAPAAPVAREAPKGSRPRPAASESPGAQPVPWRRPRATAIAARRPRPAMFRASDPSTFPVPKKQRKLPKIKSSPSERLHTGVGSVRLHVYHGKQPTTLM